MQSSWQVSLQTTLVSIYHSTAQIRSCWRVSVVKTSGDLSRELCDPSRIKEVKILISHWVFCLSSARHNWFDPAVVFPPTAAAAAPVAAAWVRVTGPNRLGLSMRTMSDIVSLFAAVREGPEGCRWLTKQWSHCDEGQTYHFHLAGAVIMTFDTGVSHQSYDFKWGQCDLKTRLQKESKDHLTLNCGVKLLMVPWTSLPRSIYSQAGCITGHIVNSHTCCSALVGIQKASHAEGRSSITNNMAK